MRRGSIAVVTVLKRRFVAGVALVVVAAVVAACVMNPGAGDLAKLRRQAQAALTRWADAVAAAGGPSRVVLVGELTGQVGDWEVAVGDNNKSALYAGLVEAAVALPADVPRNGEVRWQDGTSVTVPVLSAQQALAAIRSSATSTCGECTAMRVTAANLTAGTLETSRGPAEGPVWEFTVEGTAVRVSRVAVAHPIVVVPPPWNPEDAPIGPAIDSATGTVGGREITVAFTGAPSPGDQPCGEDYTTEAAESDLAVVVIVVRHPHLTFGGGCSAVGARRTATVQLATPLGDRSVLEVQQGLPVPVVLTR